MGSDSGMIKRGYAENRKCCPGADSLGEDQKAGMAMGERKISQPGKKRFTGSTN
jgi:hypothetical protein